jgi:hypothetical protein
VLPSGSLVARAEADLGAILASFSAGGQR